MKYWLTVPRYMMYVVAMIVLTSSMMSQRFGVVNFNSANFPKIQAEFIAQDQADQDYKNIVPGDFIVKENGKVIPVSNVRVSCENKTIEPASNVVMVLDRSQSMNDDTVEAGITRWKWVQDGAKEFINTFKFIPPSEVALVSFGSTARLEQSFTNNKTKLIKAIDTLRPSGATDYNPPMLDSTIGSIALLQSKPKEIRRVVIFLTDGDPLVDPRTDTIIARCQRENIIFYAITVGMPMNTDLQRIASLTGGKAWAVYSKSRLLDVYKTIALENTVTQQCFLEWDAPFGCTEESRQRNYSLEFTRYQPSGLFTSSYIAPPNSVARVAVEVDGIEQNIAYFGNPNPGTPVTKQIKFTAQNGDVTFFKEILTPAGFYTVKDNGGKTFPFTLKAGQSWTITVEFNQTGGKVYRQAALYYEANPCPPFVNLVGGQTDITLITPIKDTIFSACDSIDIQWAGVEPTTPVIISYAANGNAANPNWQVITSTARNFSYKWKPTVQSDFMRIRVTVAPTQSYVWATNFGGTGNEEVGCIAISPDELYTYVAGSFEGTSSCNGKSVTSNGKLDGFVYKFDGNGNVIWGQNFGGSLDDKAAGVVTDANGFVYVAGTFQSKTCNFTSNSLSLGPLDVQNMFLAKYSTDANGTCMWSRKGSGSSTVRGYSTVECISYDRANNRIIVKGRYNNRLEISASKFLYRQVNPPNTTTFPYVATFDINGNCLTLIEGNTNTSCCTQTVTDQYSNKYEIGNFTTRVTSGSIVVNSAGGQDVYIRKLGGVPGSKDSSDQTFKVQSPSISFNQTVLTMPDIAYTQNTGRTFKGVLCNTGKTPVVVESIRFQGAHASDFNLVSNIRGVVIKPDTCINIELNFEPGEEGQRSAIMEVFGNCNSNATVQVTGLGLPPCSTSTAQSVYVGATGLNLSVAKTETCIIRNESPNDLALAMQIEGGNAPSEFTAVFTLGSEVRNIKAGDVVNMTMKPGECMKADVTFTPQGVGTRSTILKYGIPSICGLAETRLDGVGVAPRLEIDSAIFGLQRIKTENKKSITVRNIDTVDALITKISLMANDAHFRFNSGSVPKTLKPNDTLQVQVTYTPQTEEFHENYVEVELSNGAAGSIRGKMNGTGFLPALAAKNITWKPTYRLSTSNENLSLEVENTKSTVPLFIESITIRNDARGEFAFVNAPPTNFQIAPNAKQSFPINFTPKIEGACNAEVVIKSDAMEGPQVAPRVNSVYTLVGSGFEVKADSVSEFGDVVSCIDTTKTIVIENTSSDPDNYTFTIVGDADFSIAPSSGTIAPGAKQTFVITYTPAPNKTSVAQLTFNSSLRPSISYALKGRGIVRTIDVQLSQVNQNAKSGESDVIKIKFTVPDLQSLTTLQNINFTVPFDSERMLFDAAALKTSQNGWTVNATPNGSTVAVSLTGNVMKQGTFEVEIPFKIYLANSKTFDTQASGFPTSECIIWNSNTLTFNFQEECSQAFREIIAGEFNFFVQVTPNPTDRDVTIDIGVGYPTHTSLELFSSVGERVALVDDSNRKDGTYSFAIPQSSLSSGTYMLVYRAGHVVKTIPVVVQK